MRKALIVFVLVGVLGFMAAGCSIIHTAPVLNNLATSSVDVSKITKTGEDCSTNFLFFTFGSASIYQAAKNAGINTIDLVDYRNSYYLLLGQNCVIVHGH